MKDLCTGKYKIWMKEIYKDTSSYTQCSHRLEELITWTIGLFVEGRRASGRIPCGTLCWKCCSKGKWWADTPCLTQAEETALLPANCLISITQPNVPHGCPSLSLGCWIRWRWCYRRNWGPSTKQLSCPKGLSSALSLWNE